jgi:hypothetical protein
MPYGTIKVDTITFTDAGVDKSVAISGLVQNPTFTGNVTATGTISGLIVQAPTVTGTTANFASGVYTTQISGAIVKVPAGSAGAPSIQVGVGASVAPGLYGAGTDLLGISTGGAGRIFIDSTGRLGVGTSSPQYPLQINAATAQIRLEESSASTKRLELWIDSSGVATIAANQSSQSIAFQTVGAESLRIDSVGNVGIGTSSPAARLHVFGSGEGLRVETSASSGGYIRFVNTSGSMSIGMGGAVGNNLLIYDRTNNQSAYLYTGGAGGSHIWSTNNTERLRIDSSGNVGIGTSSPSIVYRTTINGDGSSIVGGLSLQNNGTETLTIGNVTAVNNVDSEIWNPRNGYLRFATNNTERLRIDSSGRLLVGRSATEVGLGGSDLLQVAGAINVVSSTNIYSRLLPTSSGLEIIANAFPANLGTTQSIILKSGTSGGGGPSEIARFTSDGRLLVGTSTAFGSGVNDSNYSLIQIRGNTAGGGSEGRLTLGNTTASASIVAGNDLGSIWFADGSGGDYARILAEADGAGGSGDYPGCLVFSTTADGASSPTERMRISSTGQTRLGHANNEYNLYVNGSATSGFTTALLETDFSGYAPNNTTAVFIKCGDTAAIRAEIRSNGGLANFSANNVNLSDRNAKKDIVPAAGTWNYLKEWEIVNFRYKDQPDDADLNMGVIAQQVAESCPEVITVFQEAKEATEDQPAREQQLGVKDQQMMWMAIKALQEAQSRIETLEAKVAALEGN